ncbi:MAG TPA: hypothetical protein VKB65_01745, partial [Myxococcota bacterium]|nr:hypothetical protein [Myxococcota bacterium]
LVAGGEPTTEPLFWALPAGAESPPPDAVALREYRSATTGERAYSVDATLSLPGFTLQPDGVALVWQNPMPAVTLPVQDYLDPIVVDAGVDQCTVEDAPGQGTTVLLNGLETTVAEAGFDEFAWTWEGGSAEGIAALVDLPLGVYSIRLDASAPDGTGGHDYVTIEVAEHVTTVCNDGIDNDGDTLVDFPADLGCTNGADASEQSPELLCDDGVDNDGDGWIDYPADPGCNTNIAAREDPECDDGIDNDGDGLVDWDAPGGGDPDPQCVNKPWRNSEAGEGCGLGGEVAPLLLGLAGLRRRRTQRGR